MPKNNGFPEIWTIGQIAEELGVQYRAVRYVTHRRRTLIEPSIVLRGINFYDRGKRDEIVAALVDVAEFRRDRAEATRRLAARREAAAVPAA